MANENLSKWWVNKYCFTFYNCGLVAFIRVQLTGCVASWISSRCPKIVQWALQNIMLSNVQNYPLSSHFLSVNYERITQHFVQQHPGTVFVPFLYTKCFCCVSYLLTSYFLLCVSSVVIICSKVIQWHHKWQEQFCIILLREIFL